MRRVLEPHDAVPGAWRPHNPTVFKLDKRLGCLFSKAESSAFAVYTAIATAFSSSLISFLKPCPLWCHRQNVLPYTGLPQCDEHVEEGSVRKELRSKPFVGASFQLADSTRDKMKSCRHKERWGGTFELWQQVFNLLIRQETR